MCAMVGEDVVGVSPAAVLASAAVGIAADARRVAALGAAATSISALPAVASPPLPTTAFPVASAPRPLPTSPPVPSRAPSGAPLSAPGRSTRAAVPALGAAPSAAAAATVYGSTASLKSPSVPLRAASQAAGRRAAAAAASAAASAVAVGRHAGAARGGGPIFGSPRVEVGTLEQDLHAGVSNWAGGRGDLGRTRSAGFIQPVPTEVLRSAETTRATLQALCAERTIVFGADDSDQSLKTSLLRFNACASTKSGSELQWLAVHVRRQAASRRGRLSGFQAAVAHPSSVGVDRAASPPASSRPRGDPPIALFPAAKPPLHPQPRLLQRPPSPAPPPSLPEALPASPPSEPDAEVRTDGRHSTPLPVETTSPDGVDDRGTHSASRQSSAVLAARMVQTLLQEESEREAERKRAMASAAQVSIVQSTVSQVLTKLDSFSQSQAAANARLDGAFVGVVNGQTAVMAAAADISSSLRAGKRPNGAVKLPSGPTKPPSKKTKSGGTPTPPSLASGTGGQLAAAETRVDYHCALVHDWTLPAEMLASAFVSQPLFKQLTEMVRSCHVSVDHPGLFGSYACLRVYEEGVERTAKVLSEGGTAGTINAAKTEKMKNVVKNKADHWLKQLFWLHGLLPTVLNEPAQATFERMQEFKLTDADCTTLANTIRERADEVGWPSTHPIRTKTKARVSTLRKLLGAMAGTMKVESNVSVILTTAPFDGLLAAATENVRKKYT